MKWNERSEPAKTQQMTEKKRKTSVSNFSYTSIPLQDLRKMLGFSFAVPRTQVSFPLFQLEWEQCNDKIVLHDETSENNFYSARRGLSSLTSNLRQGYLTYTRIASSQACGKRQMLRSSRACWSIHVEGRVAACIIFPKRCLLLYLGVCDVSAMHVFSSLAIKASNGDLPSRIQATHPGFEGTGMHVNRNLTLQMQGLAIEGQT